MTPPLQHSCIQAKKLESLKQESQILLYLVEKTLGLDFYLFFGLDVLVLEIIADDVVLVVDGFVNLAETSIFRPIDGLRFLHEKPALGAGVFLHGPTRLPCIKRFLKYPKMQLI